MTGRQKSLYLAARLYELAAEFTDDELQDMLKEQSVRNGSAAIRSAIKALMALHLESVSASPNPDNGPTILTTTEIENSGLHAFATVSRQTSSLLEIFADRSAFPTVSSIAEIIQIPSKNKEPRDRYLARVSRQIDAFSIKDRERFFGSLTSRLDKQPNNFISKWSRVIKDL